jgi:CheY-like chemotaxis protein
LSLVKDLLDVTSYEQGLKPEYLILNLHTFLKSFHKDFDLQASQKKVGFHYDNSVPDWMVLADPDRMYQLLQNLVTNALKFTESGKNIFLKVTPFQGRRKSDPSFPMIIISIKDEGKGIPESELQKIFDKFTQLKESSRQGGRGLGLTVAKQISTLHDGNLWVESKQGQGSTFFVLLPHVLSLADKMPAPNQKRVLVVEPQEEKRLKNYQCLTEWGYELVFAKDGVEAVTLLHHIRPQAIILTRDLTKISSAEVSRLLKSTPVGQSTAIFLAVEKNQPILGNLEDKLLIDSKLVLPLEKHHWDACLAAHKSLKAA